MEAYAGVILGVSFCFTWAVVFGPNLVGNRRLAWHVAATSLAFLVCYACMCLFINYAFRLWCGVSNPVMPMDCPNPCLSFSLALVIIAVYTVIASALQLPKKALPIWSIIFMVLTIWAPLKLHKIAQMMWNSYPKGSVRGGTEWELAGVHIFAMFLLVFLSVIVWVAVWRKAPATVKTMAIGTFVSALLSGVAFCYTMPREGDEGTLIWPFFLLPVALIVSMIVLLTCIIAPIVSGLRARRTAA